MILIKDKKNQFQGYVRSYLDNYLEKYSEKILNEEFYSHLLEQIFSNSMKTLLTLFLAFKNENLLKGNSSEERYWYFDNYSSTEEFHQMVNRLYPLLKERLDKIIHNHLINYKDLKMRVEENKEEIYKEFGFDINNMTNCHIRYGLSDYHRGLKSIYIIENESRRIVYKPRSGKIDIHWTSFIEWFNSKKPSLKLDNIKVLDKGEYCWQEFIENSPVESGIEVQRLYYRMGILSAIAYIFNMEDLHMENIIVNGEFPYIVDLETIFQVDGFQSSDLELKSATDILNKRIRKSVLSTQLFPVSTKLHKSDVDISGITGKGGQVIKGCKVKIVNQFTDEIKVVREDGATEHKGNIGRMKEQYIDPKDYTREIIGGFKEGYILLQNNKKELLELINSGELFDDVNPRYLFRNTNLYATILEMSKNPKYLKYRSDMNRLYHLLFNTKKNVQFKEIYESELEDLFNDDIPYFYGNINSKTIYNSRGSICFTLNKTPLIKLNEKILDLSEEDMKSQIDFIEKTMARHKKTWNTVRERTSHRKLECEVNKELLIKTAKNIGDTLINNAIIHENTGTINWIDLQNSFPTWAIKAQDISLYSGLAGNAIFFCSLYMATGDKKYEDTLQKILRTIEIDRDKISNENTSVFNGIYSLAYLYAFLYNQTVDKNMLEKSRHIVQQYQGLISDNMAYDVIDGISGILILVLNIYELSMDESLKELAISIGESLVKNIQLDNGRAYWRKNGVNELIIAGFSHGLSGVIYGLSKLYKVTENKQYRHIIKNLINVENSYYDNKAKNWIDLRVGNTSEIDNTPIHWCHGASGIGLSRIKCADIIDTSSDIEKSLGITNEKGLYLDSDCLCHGNLGNIEFLLEAYKASGKLGLYHKSITRISEMMAENKQVSDYKNGVGQEFNSPGFMLGLSGIGYEMLRISDFNKYASVLLLEV